MAAALGSATRLTAAEMKTELCQIPKAALRLARWERPARTDNNEAVLPETDGKSLRTKRRNQKFFLFFSTFTDSV